MLNSKDIQNLLVVVAIALFAIFANAMMRFLEFEEVRSSSINYILFGVFAISTISQMLSSIHIQSSFSWMWILWICWLFIDFYLFGLRGSGLANFFIATMAPMTFLLFYHSTLSSEKIEKIAIIGFIIIFVLAYYQNIKLMNTIISLSVFGEEGSQSNIVYWCLCALPFLLLVEKRWLQIALLLLMIFITILTGKRSVTIIILIVGLFYAHHFLKGKNKSRNIFLLLLAFIAGYFFVTRYLGDAFAGVVQRLGRMGEEGDSSMSRIIIYRACIDVLKNNNLIDWLVGRGYETVRQLSGHTNAHNDALQMLFEYGIVGLSFYITMLVISVKRMILLKKIQSKYYIGYMASVVIFIVLGMVSNLVVFYSYFAYICAFWGMIEARLVQDNLIKVRMIL